MKNNIQITRFGKNQLKQYKLKWVKPVLLAVVIAVFIYVVSLKVENNIRNCIIELSVDSDANATWISSLASYWGGILGGIFSGIIAVVGVFYTIRFTREADRHKERQSVQPFLNAQLKERPLVIVGSFEIKSKSKVDTRSLTLSQVYLTIKNIGNGFANTLTFDTGENFMGNCFKEVFTVNEEKTILIQFPAMRCGEKLEFSILFVDSMTNEYIQRYELKRNLDDTGYELDIGYPDLIGEYNQ